MWGTGGVCSQARKKGPVRAGSRTGPCRAARVRRGSGSLIGLRQRRRSAVLGRALHLSSSAAVSARPSATKLSRRPARLARSWHRTSGRLASVEPRQAVGAAGPADVLADDLGGGRGGDRLGRVGAGHGGTGKQSGSGEESGEAGHGMPRVFCVSDETFYPIRVATCNCYFAVQSCICGDRRGNLR